MTLSLVQHASGAANTDTVTITLAATGTGNALVIAASYNQVTTDEALSSITLGGSGTGFSSQFYRTATGAVTDVNIWANFSIAGGQTSLVVTGQAGNTNLLSVDVYEVSGGLSSLDKTSFNEVDGGAASWTSNATATTTVAAEFILGIVQGYNNAGGTITFTGPGSPWVNETQLTPGSGAGGQLSGYQISSTTGTFTYSGTANTTGSNLFYVAGVATFASSTPSAGPAFHPRNTALQAKRQRLPLQGRIRSSPGGPASTTSIVAIGKIGFQPLRLQGYTSGNFSGLLDSSKALSVLNAILLQEPVASVGGLTLRLGSNAPAATVPMTELPNGNGYTAGGQACAFNTASAGAASNSSALTWTNTSGGWEVIGLEFWDETPAIGLRWLYSDWSGNPVAIAAGNTFAIPSGSLDIYLR